jgi:hypothetical protein
MVVSVNKGGRDNAVSRINTLGIGKARNEVIVRPDVGNVVSLDRHTPTRLRLAGGISPNHSSQNQGHGQNNPS